MKKRIIAGPCSAESYEQLHEVARHLKDVPCLTTIRAGVWKPRTRPGCFEGLGEPALRWMQEIGREFGVSFCCEVARPEHVEMCLQYGIHTVWLGARTTTNPFMVDEICSAISGNNIEVLVKNPICPDVRLWLGAIERLQHVGITALTAIHRGFSMYHNNGYRNAPLWEVALELRREMPDIPILCDPSHIAGRRDLVPILTATALQLDYDGLMVEVHPHPASAWTDAEQQIDFTTLLTIAETWNINEKQNTTPLPELGPLRDEIDSIDHGMLRMLARRMELSHQIADIKRQKNMTVYQQGRWTDVIEDRLALAQKLGLDTKFTKDILERIHAESVRVQLGELKKQ